MKIRVEKNHKKMLLLLKGLGIGLIAYFLANNMKDIQRYIRIRKM